MKLILVIELPINSRRHEVLPKWVRENPHFVGRMELIETLRHRLSQIQSGQYNHRVALYGLGGVGKTQLAVQYVVKYKNNYNAVFWISATNHAGLLSGYQDIAASVRCSSVPMDDKEVVDAVLLWFKEAENWLLVLDGILDEIPGVDSYLPDSRCGSHGHILITTRCSDTINIPAQGLKVDVFTPDEAQDLLLLRTSLIDDLGKKNDLCIKIRSEALKIVEELGYLALAIEQAAAYIRVHLKDIFRFLNVFKIHGPKILGERPTQN